MTGARQRLGRTAEDRAASALIARGWQVIERNVRVRDRESGVAGELDIVALDGRALVVVEVRARREGSRAGPAGPLESIGSQKRHRLRLLVRAWLAERSGSLPRHEIVRFDVVGIVFDPAGRMRSWEHIRDAF